MDEQLSFFNYSAEHDSEDIVDIEKSTGRDDRRDSSEEKWQKERLCAILKKSIAGTEFRLDFTYWNTVSRGRESMYVSSDGKLTYNRDKIKVIGRDSKSLDALAIVRNGDKELHLFFFLKYTKENGGSQGDIAYEVSRTVDNAKKVSDNKAYFMFMLEGGFWENDKIISDMEFGGKAINLPNSKDVKETNTKIEEMLKEFIVNYFSE